MSAPPASRPRLVVTGGPLDGREVFFDEGAERRFGTAADCDLQVQAGHIEPVHATAVLEDGRLVLNDAGSVAGTYVNGEKVGTGRELHDGDRVCLGPPGFRGSVKMVVSLQASQEEEAPVLLDPAAFAPAAPEPGPAFGDHHPTGSLDLGGGDDGFKLDDTAPVGAAEEDWTLAAPAEVVPLEPEPVAPPAAVAAAPPAAPAPPPAAPPPPAPALRAPRTATAEDYSDGISIAAPTPRADTPRTVPPPVVAARPEPRPSGPRPGTDWKRVLILNGVITVTALVALLAWRAFNRPTAALSTLSTPKARAGETLTVRGVHLGGAASDWTVRFGEVTATPTAVTEEAVTVTVPAQFAKQGPPHLPVSVDGPGGRSNELLLTIVRGPAITAVEPDVALPGQSVRLRGTNLAGERLAVTVAGLPAEVSASSPTELQVVVPAVPERPEGTAVEVKVQVGTETGAPARLILGRLPLLLEATPAGGPAGVRVTLRGRGFEALPAANRVAFDQDPALVLSARADELVVSVPALAAPSPDLAITVQTPAGTSARVPFRYEVPSAAVYVPRFSAAPVAEHPGHDHAFVATAVGPVLLLSGPEGGRSAAQRAVETAEALNGLVGRVTPGQLLPLTVRAGAEPAVVAAGETRALVTVTAGDAAAFGEEWAGLKPTPTTPAALAAYWAALLQDHLTLFAVHARPLKLLELTPRAQVLLDVWSQAVRQGHGPDGVPARMLAPVPETLAAGLRALALSTPGAKSEGAPALALAGTWQGSTLENGQRRSVRMRLQVAGKGLSGVLSAQSGAVAMDMPLREVSYRNGELRFKVLAGGAPRTFQGLFDGRQVSGTITGATGPIGDFRLELVE